MTADGSELALTLPRNAFWELGAIAKHADRLADIEECARRLGPAPDKQTAAKGIADSLSLPEKDVRNLLNGLLNLHIVRERNEIEVAEIWKAIVTAAEAQGTPSWKAEFLEPLKSAREQALQTLTKLTADHPLSVCQKAEELTYKHQNVISDSHIITDLRPVFSESGADILEAVIAHTLWIEYLDGGSAKTLEFAIDATDLAELHKWCERAERKAMTLKDSLSSVDWPTRIARQKTPENEGS